MSKNIIPIKDLPLYIKQLCLQLQKMDYSESTCRRTRTVLKQYCDFAVDNGMVEYDSFSVQKFVISKSGDNFQDVYHSYRYNRPFSMLDDFIRTGTIFRQKYRSTCGFEGSYANLFQSYLNYMQSRNYAKDSIQNCRSHLLRFQNYLLDNGISEPKSITHELIKQYVYSLTDHSTSFVCQVTRELKNLFKFAKINEILLDDFSGDLPHFKNTRMQRLPDRFTADEINKILAAIDRNNPLGKRDYAIVLICIRLGLRSCDAISLKFGSIDWSKKEIHVIQKKTNVLVTLPLPEDVGWAIIDYIKNGRPESSSASIFTSHCPPYNDLTQYTNYVVKYLRKAGMYSKEGRRVGMHTLRRTLATSMLENDVPVTVIAQTLGHSDLHSVGNYIRISPSLLKKCAMEVTQFE